MARDISADLDTEGRIRPDDFIRGVIGSPRDHDWYRVTLEPGTYVFTLSGTGDKPVGDPLMILRDEEGRAIARAENAYRGTGADRLEFEVTGGPEAVFLDVGSNGPFLTRGGSRGHATGDFALGVNQLDGSPVDAIAGSVWTRERVIDVYFLPKGRTAEYGEAGHTIESAGWNTYQIRRAMAALDTFSEVCDIRFRQTEERSKADFELLLNDKRGLSYLGRFNPPGTFGEGVGVFASGPGDDFAAPWGTMPGGALERGARGFAIMVHEFGHALGLAHPHDDGFGSVVMNRVSGEKDGGAFGLNHAHKTMMSYRGIADARDPYFGLVEGPMAFDIAALQAMYGATRSHHRDDSYVLPARNETGTGYLCLWDTGGEDTIRAGRTERACTIDLNAATLAYEPGGGGFLSSPRGIRGGFTIANGVEIENAAGGGGADRLVGNELANRLAGGAGADSFRGRAGADRLSAGDDDDRDVFLYRSAPDSGPTVAEADRIGGFDHRNGPREGTWDRLDLAGLDADPDARGDQDLRFVRAFSAPDGGEPPGQVRAQRQGDDIHLLIDLDGDKAADMRLILLDTPRITALDCLL